jgi:hypothetical protein
MIRDIFSVASSLPKWTLKYEMQNRGSFRNFLAWKEDTDKNMRVIKLYTRMIPAIVNSQEYEMLHYSFLWYNINKFILSHTKDTSAGKGAGGAVA